MGGYGVRYCVAYIKKLPADVAGGGALVIKGEGKGVRRVHFFTCIFSVVFYHSFPTKQPRFTGTLMLLSVALRLRKSLPSAV